MRRAGTICPARLRALRAIGLARAALRAAREGDRPAAVRSLIALDRDETDRNPLVRALARTLIARVERRLGLPPAIVLEAGHAV